MSNQSFQPPHTPAPQTLAALEQNGFVLLDPNGVEKLLQVPLSDLEALTPSWDRLCPDLHLKDQGQYRKRRHASYVVDANLQLICAPHRAHWQPLSYNALHGGVDRWFEPVEPQVAKQHVWQNLLVQMTQVAQKLPRPDLRTTQSTPENWFIETHQFRIDTANGIGRPTPEGAHRDGVDLVGVFILSRRNIKGGESRVFAIDSPNGQRFTIEQPWSLLLMDDTRVIHETTPILPIDPAQIGWRDTLVVTIRRGGFLELSTHQNEIQQTNPN